MIKAVAFQSMVEVSISSGPTFFADLARFKSDIKPADRTWDEYRCKWKVANPRNYSHIPYIKTALEERKHQPELF